MDGGTDNSLLGLRQRYSYSRTDRGVRHGPGRALPSPFAIRPVFSLKPETAQPGAESIAI